MDNNLQRLLDLDQNKSKPAQNTTDLMNKIKNTNRPDDHLLS